MKRSRETYPEFGVDIVFKKGLLFSVPVGYPGDRPNLSVSRQRRLAGCQPCSPIIFPQVEESQALLK
jgi:hypothetical protein